MSFAQRVGGFMTLIGSVLRDAGWNRGTPPRGRYVRTAQRFRIGPNSHPRKVQRWFAKGGGIPVETLPHIHPRRLRPQ